MRALLISPGEVGGEQIPLDQIARVDQHDLIRVLGAQGLEDRGRARQPPRRRDIVHVVPSQDAPVHVRGGDDYEVGGIGSGGRWGGRGRYDGVLRRDEQREEHAHSAL